MTKALTIVGFGDSITRATPYVAPHETWMALLEGRLGQEHSELPCRLINAGVGGNTTREGLARMETDVHPHRPDIVLSEFGNDATSDPKRHVTLAEYADNFDTIRREVCEVLGAALILLTFPPIINGQHQNGHEAAAKPFGGKDEQIDQYRKHTRQLAIDKNLPLADTDHVLRERIARDGWEPYIKSDGVHLTARGNAVFADAVYEVLLAAMRRR